MFIEQPDMSTGTDAGPQEIWQAGVDRGEYQSDAAQAEAVALLQSLYEALTRARATGRWARLSARLKSGAGFPWVKVPSAGASAIKGLYFWGGVGRGKTFLMDLFYESLPFTDKTRLHFHRFMREVHEQLRQLQGQVSPLRKVADNFADRTRVICFDEFFVGDITDAMLLAGLLDEMFRRGMVLVATSNVAPDNLYRDGLQRRRFLPAIELLKQHTQVHNLDGGIDYRLRALESAEIYHVPLDEAAESGLAAAFKNISPDAGRAGVTLTIEGRPIHSRYCGDGVVWFDFAAVCDGPRSQNDYVELARLFQTVLVGKIPIFDKTREAQARRFISLVDEFYDRHVKLIVSAAAPAQSLYQGSRLAFEFQRTQSRLQEMQSIEYLGREHKA